LLTAPESLRRTDLASSDPSQDSYILAQNGSYLLERASKDRRLVQTILGPEMSVPSGFSEAYGDLATVSIDRERMKRDWRRYAHDKDTLIPTFATRYRSVRYPLRMLCEEEFGKPPRDGVESVEVNHSLRRTTFSSA